MPIGFACALLELTSPCPHPPPPLPTLFLPTPPPGIPTQYESTKPLGIPRKPTFPQFLPGFNMRNLGNIVGREGGRLLLLLQQQQQLLLLLLLLLAAPPPPPPTNYVCLNCQYKYGRGGIKKTVSNMTRKCFPRRVLVSSRRPALRALPGPWLQEMPT